MFDDPFNYGEDPEIEFGDLMASGKQSATVPRPPTDETSKDGFLKFPQGHNIEIASLGLYIRGDVRKCALLVAGGVYENLLFFPVIQLLKEKYPGVSIDVVATARGKQAYEMNKNVRRAWVYDVEDVQVVPADYMDMLGKLKVRMLPPGLECSPLYPHGDLNSGRVSIPTCFCTAGFESWRTLFFSLHSN